MAAWRMQRRLLSLITSSGRQPNISFRNDSAPSFLPSISSFLHGEQLHKSQTRALSKASNLTAETAIKHEASSSNSVENSVTMNHPAINNNNDVAFTAKSELKISPRHDLAMMFTCKVCETRSVKTISRESYEKGAVVARCGGCNNYHLIADHLGIFGEKCTIEDILAARGEEVKKGNSDTLNLTLEDLVGMTKS
ncbi:putative mitochondrial import protein TIM15 [Helianthus annuus]|uniref:Mitochondrial import protein TIM15 n=1 Tax=Helianthus annuus TaxID=4232 RepID=A0A251U5G9_HELAN|nr:DNL-type zinc finger protein [Helianthus annuus]KAF5794612.1 putative mitochondrial import protein TIM15 [Helianthus annuus]KAJ0900913.1 putative mitochondrial import protein TIM15 [Helianthus annuus]